MSDVVLVDTEDDEESNSAARLVVNLSSSYFYVRMQSVKKTVEFYQRAGVEGDIKPGFCRRLERLIMTAFIDGHYTEKAYRTALLDAFTVALTADGLPIDLKILAADHLKETSSRLLLASAKVSTIELCLTLLQVCDSAFDLPIWAIACTQTMGEVLDTLDSTNSGKNEKIMAICTRKIGSLLRSNEKLLDHAINCWTEAGHIGSLSHLHLYFSTLRITPPFAGVSKRPKRITIATYESTLRKLSKSVTFLINSKIINSKQSLTAMNLRQLNRFLKSLSTTEWNDSKSTEECDTSVGAEGGGLEAATLRAMKKSPEGSSGIIAAILCNVDVDLSNFIKSGGAVAALRISKSPNLEVRECGSRIVRNMALKCHDSSAFELMVRLFIEALLGKGPAALVQSYQRLSVLQALRACSEGSHLTSMGRSFISDLAGQAVVPALITAIEKENDENNMNVASEVLGGWIGLMTTLTSPPTLMESIKTGMGRSKGHCVTLLAALISSVRRNIELSADMLPLVPALVNVVKEASKKPSNQAHIDAVLAFRLLLEISVSSSVAVAAIVAAKLGSCLAPSSSSFLYSKSLLQNTNLVPASASTPLKGTRQQQAAVPDGTRRLYSLVADSMSATVLLVSLHHTSMLVGTTVNGEVASDSPVSIVLSCLLHPDREVRAGTSKRLRRVFSNGTVADEKASSLYPSALKMLKAFLSSLSSWSDQLEIASTSPLRSAEEATDEDPVFSSSAAGARIRLGVPPLSRMSEVLLALVSYWHASTGKNQSTVAVAERHTPSAQVVAMMLLACAHPLVCESRTSASMMWCRLTSSLEGGGGEGVGELLEPDEFRTAICKKVVSAAMSSSARLTRQSAHTALFILSTSAGKAGSACVLQKVLPSLKEKLLGCGISAVSDDEIDKYLNPLAAIAAESAAAADVSVAEVRITNADRKKDSGRSRRTGAFGSDFVEDEDWAEKVKKEKAQKVALAKNAEQTGGTSAKLKELEEMQVRVKSVVDSATFALEAYQSITCFAVPEEKSAEKQHSESSSSDEKLRAVTRSSTSSMLPVLIPLMRCALVSENAFLCVLGQCRAIEGELQVMGTRDLADSLRISATVSLRPLNRKVTQEGIYREMLGLSAPLQRLLRTLQTYLSRMQSAAQQQHRTPRHQVLLPSTVHLLFPVLKGLLSMPILPVGCDFAFMVLDSIWPKPPAIEGSLQPYQHHMDSIADSSLLQLQRPVTEICLSTLAHLRVDPPPDAVLYRLVTQYLHFPPSTEDEVVDKQDWIAPLLGDQGLLSAEVNVQLACLKAIEGVLKAASSPATSQHSRGVIDTLSSDSLFESRLWLAKYHDDTSVRTLAETVWAARGLPLNATFSAILIPLFSYTASTAINGNQESSAGQHVRLASARAMAGGIKALPQTCEACITQLKSLFHSYKPVPVAANSRLLSNMGGGVTGKGKDINPRVSAPVAAAVMVDANPSARLAVAEFIRAAGADMALPLFEESAQESLDLLDFVLAYGTVDYNSDIRSAMLTAGRALADSFGAAMCRPMLTLLERVLTQKPASKSPDDLAAYDHRHSAAVVLMGAVGRHLSAEDPSVVGITESMVTALQTPSEGVQKAVADCLVQLVQVMKSSPVNGEKAKDMLERLMLSAMEEDTYGRRRGAAYGIGAFVKGLGIPSLKAHDVVPRLKEACTNGTVNARQGALFAIECLSERLGLLFEPYVITIVPILLKSFSHASDHVREAAQGAAKVIMGRLSAHGVKQVLTPILTSLPEETQWKSRQEAIKLLGYMAHCAPKQLAACLPQIVPRLVEAGSDPHPKVKEGARAAMLDISSVIRNPEISRLAPVLLAAMADPANKTKEALEALLECEFMHSIDAPSLALLVPILGRALRDRGADLKRKASAITGNMVTMVSEPKTLVPYLVQVLPGLKDCLLDPIPDVRATSAKALGSLVGGVGEEELSELVPWLMSTLQSEASPVERSGAAQGLAEVCLALGEDRLDEILDTALTLRNQPKSAAREGLLWLLSFLPSVLAEGFASHIKTTLPVILSGLSDESEGVREVALRSGQVMVTVLGSNNALLLLPSLSEGMFDDDWRIRHSSLILLGDLLYLVGDTKAVGMADGEEEDEDLAGVSTGNRVTATLRTNIGEINANEVLAALYIVRSDVSMSVRQSALQVWKSVVSNTPRTLVEIIPALIDQLIAKLSAESAELRVVAGKSLGELVRKMGDRVLPVVVPHLRQQLRVSSNMEGGDALRQGVCLGLTEILASASKRQVEDYLDSLMPALQQALCDKSEAVRSQAAKAFQTLFKNIGPRAIDGIVPALLARMGFMVDEDDDDDEDEDVGSGAKLDDEDEDMDEDGSDEECDEEEENSLALALLGLQGVVQLRPRDLLEYLLDSSYLLRHPMHLPAAKILAGIVQVSGAQLNYHFSTLLPALCIELHSAAESVEKLEASVAAFLTGEGITACDATEELASEKERLNAIKECAGSVMGAVTTSGVNFLSSELGRQIEHEGDVRRRRWGCWLLEQFVRRSKAVFSDYLPVLFKYLLGRVAEFDKQLLQAVSDALLALSTCVPLEELSGHLDFIRSCVNSTASDARHRAGSEELFNSVTGAFNLPLLTIPKSLEPFLTIALHALMNGSLQSRETAADVIAELAAMADPLVLKPYLIKTTGPLIRVVGDRFPSNVKAAILQTLAVLLDKGGGSLKAFVPQLQTTFVKSLSDPSKLVRQRGSAALGKLMALNARVDPLLVELAVCAAQADGPAIKASTLEALAAVLMKGGGEKASPASIEKVKVACMSSLIEGEEESVRAAAASCASALTIFMDSTAISDMLINLCGSTNDAASLCGRLLGAGAVLQTAGQKAAVCKEEVYLFLTKGLKDDRPAVKTAACSALMQMFSTPPALVDSVGAAATSRKGEYRTTAQGALHAFSQLMGSAAGDASSVEVRKAAMTAIKLAAKSYPIASQLHMQHFMPPLIAAVKDINIRLKYIAERAMMYLLDGGANPTLLATYTASVDVESARFVKEYARRSLSRLPADSDDELNDKW